ncbi:MAG: succinate dehydrogenase, cytochrome b556 subunit [Legionellaceae bacterium]|nr:succinate dehydrogenase, cytochrome b556 subunit [Legionellaceae bacterium]
MRKERPVNLNLTTIKFPITAIVSILHRLSGLFLIAMLPFGLWIFEYAMRSEANFNYWVTNFMHSFWGGFLLWLFFIGFVYHLVAGVRHLLMDLGWGESLRGGRIGAGLLVIIWLAVSILLGILLWVGIF